ncbi:MAG: hypothetical protein LUG13_06115 [Oscillospiraceae bacterium]|nr:hypothetical protein [Oscillospiraceae bacterium]
MNSASFPEHPDISRIMRWGYYECDREDPCPVCGAEAEWLYLSRDNEVLGCDHCVRMLENGMLPEAQPWGDDP